MRDTPANRHRMWACPFFKWDGVTSISCEGGRFVFPDREAADEYLTLYCAANPDWRTCSVAAALFAYYDRQEEDADEKRRQDKNAGKSE